MLRILYIAVAISAWALGPVAASRAADSDGTLRQLIDNAVRIQREKEALALPNTAESTDSTARVRNWLASPPVLAASYLESDQPWGTDETEISLSFPLLSPAQRRIGAELYEADPALAAASDRYRRWQLTGIIGDLLSQHSQCLAELELAIEEANLLADLEASSQRLVTAGSIASFDLWLVRQKLRDARVSVQKFEAQLDAIDSSFQALTGAGVPAPDFAAFRSVPDEPAYHNHPEFLLYKALFTQQLASLNASSSGFTPWTLGVVGREFAVPDRNERQLGVSVSIPVDFGSWTPRSVRSSELALREQLGVQLDTWRVSLRNQWVELSTRRNALLAEQQALTQDRAMIELTKDMSTLSDNREMPIENRVERRLLLLRANARPTLVAAELHAVEVRLWQLAGKSL